MEGRDYLAIFLIASAVVAFCAYLLFLRWRWCRKEHRSFWSGEELPSGYNFEGVPITRRNLDRLKEQGPLGHVLYVNQDGSLYWKDASEILGLDDWLAADPPLWDW